MSDIRQKITIENRQAITALNEQATAFEGVAEAAEQASNATDEGSWRQIGSRISGSLRSATASISSMNSGFSAMISKTRNVGSSIGHMVTRLAAAAASFIGIKKLVDLSDELTATTARLSSMNDGLQTTKELQDQIYQAAQRSRGSYADMASVVARFGNNAKDAFSSTQEVIQFSELVQKQLAIAGSTGAEASNAMLQLSQALGSGVLRGDELNSIFEQAPNLIQTIADYMGKPIGEIRTLASEGKITADIVKQAMFSASDQINERFSQMPMTWSQRMQQFKNTALNAFGPLLQGLNDLANSKAFQILQERIVSIMGSFASVANQVMGAIVSLTGGSVTTETVSDDGSSSGTTALLEDQAAAQEEVASSTEKTAKATKQAAKAQADYNASVMSFDELHKIGGNSPSLPETTASVVEPSDLSEVQDLNTEAEKLNGTIRNITKTSKEAGKENPFTSFFSQIKDKILSQDFDGLGTLLGEKAKGLIHRFAEWFDGKKAGALIGGAISGFINFIKTTFSNPDDWHKIGTEMGNSVNSAIDQIKPEDISEAVNNCVTSIFNFAIGFLDGQNWEEIGTKIGEGLKKVKWKDIGQKIITFIKEGIEAAGGLIKGIMLGTSLDYNPHSYQAQNARQKERTQSLKDEIEENLRNGRNPWYRGYANGGYPDTGELFLARERGPELVGSIGTQTAVANNDQIVQAVSQGVAAAVSSVLRTADNQTSETPIFLDGEQIATILNRASLRRGSRRDPNLIFA